LPPKAKEPKGLKPQSEESGTVYCVTTYEQKVDTVMYTQSATNGCNLNEWYLDSSATCHCTGCRDWLHGYKDLKSSGRYLEFANGSREDVKGTGTLIIQTKVNGGQTKVGSPKLGKNLVSTQKILVKGGRVRMDAKRYKVYDINGMMIIQGTAKNNLYAIQLQVDFPNKQVSVVTTVTSPEA